jgi:hypothetical protein
MDELAAISFMKCAVWKNMPDTLNETPTFENGRPNSRTPETRNPGRVGPLGGVGHSN